MTEEIDHDRRTDNFACPHCGYVFSDCFEWSDSDDDICCECDKKFHYFKEHETFYSTEKI